MVPELEGQTWEIPSEELAKVLSAKTRKKDALPHALETIDVIENYDCHIDDLESELDTACRNFHSNLIESNSEDHHYPVLRNFLNNCLTACLNALGDKANNAYYRDLRFFVWDKVMNDGIDGAHAVKPDLGSILTKSGDNLPPRKLFWSPPSNEAEMAVPVEVKANWRELVLQAGTYSRYLYSVSPLRLFNLVLGYHHKNRQLRFLAFHRGGLASSRDLDPSTPVGQKDILRLFLSLLTWKSRADAGFPSWYNGASISLPGQEGEMIADVDRVLHSSTCVRGRAPHVFRANLRNTRSFSSSKELGSLEPVTKTNLRRSPQPTVESNIQVDSLSPPASSPANPPTSRPLKVSTNQGRSPRFQPTVDSVNSLPRPASSPANPLSPKPLEVSTDQVMPISISQSQAAREPLVHVKHLVDWPENTSIDRNGSITLAVKLSYALSGGQKNTIIEPRLLRECGGMFGIPEQFCSFVAHHQDSYPTTNHLFRPPPGKEKEYYWNIFHVPHSPPELRTLIGNVIAFVGVSLVLAPDVSSLVQALVHAHLGYYNMCQRGFQHRDISIGNVLILDKPIPSKPFVIKQPNKTQRKILKICKKLGIKESCRGFLIDGDMAIDWDTYFGEDHDDSNSGTPEFMSKALREQAANTIHSPVDDYRSFYFTAQWACAFRKVSLGEENQLQYLRQQLAGTVDNRESGTNTVVNEMFDVSLYGSFLIDAQPFLHAWNKALADLIKDWHLERLKVNIEGMFQAETFRRYADRGLLSFLEVARLYYPTT